MKARLAIGALAVATLSAAIGSRASGTIDTAADEGVHVVSAPGRDAYSLVVHGNWRGENQSIEDMNAIHDRVQGDFLWLRRHGRTYLVRDGGRLALAQALFDSLDRLEPEQKAIAAKERALDRREEELDRERDRLEEDSDIDNDGPGPDEATVRRLQELRAESEKVRSEDRALESEERALDRRQEALEKQAEARLWTMIDRWIADGTAERR